MAFPRSVRTTALTLSAAAALTAWSLFGVFGPRAGFTDALFQPDYTIQHIQPGGPLEEAGFQAGDSVLSVEGIPVVELGMYSRWPRSLSRQPGESITMMVDRDGSLVEGRVVYRERPESSRNLQAGALAVGLSFLWCGVWAFLSTTSPHAAGFLGLGLALGMALPGPEMGSLNGVRDNLQQAGMVLWALLLLRFFLTFPRRKEIMRGHLPELLLFLPWLILLVCLALELVFHPRFYHSFGGYSGTLILVYLLLALLSGIHSAVRVPHAEIHSTGFRSVLWGVTVAMTALLLWAFDLFSLISIPWAGTLPLALCAIPFGMVMGIRKGAEEG